MAYILGDIYIGDFPLTQDFGADPITYSARYPGMKGHNGVDIGCPLMTPILATADGIVSFVASSTLNTFDTGGFGNYIKLHHDGFLSLYGHLNDIAVSLGDHVVAGQLIGHSGSSGWSSGPHLHFGIAPCDVNGNKTEPDNGYSGYIDPNGELCKWEIKNPSAPINPQHDVSPPASIPQVELNVKTVQANNFLSIIQYGLNNGLGVFLTNHGQSLDLINDPADTAAASKVNSWIASLLHEIDKAKAAQYTVTTNPPPTNTQTTFTQSAFTSPSTIPPLTETQKTGLIQAIGGWIKDFIFVKV